MNNKAINKILSVYWFVILLIVAGGVFAMVYTFYHHPSDVREVEADILADKIADCLSQDGRMKGTPDEFENLLEKCKLNFNTGNEQLDEQGQYYAQIDFFDPIDTKNSFSNVNVGNKNLIPSCKIQEDKDYERLSKCVEKRFYSIGVGNEQYLINILSIVRKVEQNAK